MVAKTCHSFSQYLGGNSAREVEFDNGDIIYIPPSQYDQFVVTMQANGLDEPYPGSYVVDCVDLMQEIASGVRSESIADMDIDKPAEDHIYRYSMEFKSLDKFEMQFIV